MGSGSSKPEQHVFSANAPVSFSQSLLDSLQRNPETDSTRAQTKELHLQRRVNAELTRLRDTGASQLSQLTDSLTTKPDSLNPSLKPSAPTRDPNTLAAHLSSPFYQDHAAGKATPSPEQIAKPDSGRSSDMVQKEVTDLRKKLEARKGVSKPSPEVEKAREGLVQCLRTKDRRPLDCWQEVEDFKREVGKLEQVFVQKAGR